MILPHALQTAYHWLRARHTWTVPAILLLVSHLCFAGGGAVAALVSIPLSYFALTYFQKHNTSHHGSIL
jgi:hypothetical protein